MHSIDNHCVLPGPIPIWGEWGALKLFRCFPWRSLDKVKHWGPILLYLGYFLWLVTWKVVNKEFFRTHSIKTEWTRSMPPINPAAASYIGRLASFSRQNCLLLESTWSEEKQRLCRARSPALCNVFIEQTMEKEREPKWVWGGSAPLPLAFCY